MINPAPGRRVAQGAALAPSVRPLTAMDFDLVRDLARDTCGISLPEAKKALVSSRLERLVRHYGFDSFTAYIHFVSRSRHSPEFTEFIDTLTTNHSGFWREPEHFVFLQKTVFPLKNRARIWSAACATGEEPYTIAMCAVDAGVQSCSVTATDISRAALGAAMRGEYEAPKTAALPTGWPDRYFTAVRTRPAAVLTVAPRVRALVAFSPLNLLQPFGHLGIFDVIFCRNVMIYFDQETRDRLVESLVAQLPEGGYLFTGHSETLLRLPPGLRYVQPATYRRA